MLADTSAAKLLSIAMLVSFCPIVSRLRIRISEAALADDVPRQADQLRAHLEARPLHLVQVDVEVDDVAPQPEGNHSSPLREALHVRYREGAAALQGLEDLGQTGLLRGADEEDLEVARRGRRADPPDLRLPALDRLARERPIEDLAERILAHDRDDEGR